MYTLTHTTTRRALPLTIASLRDLQAYVNRKEAESVGSNKGGDVVVLLDGDGRTLALYESNE